MIDEALLAEIRKVHADAKFGYGAITSQLYVRHVGALLEFQQYLLTSLGEMHQQSNPKAITARPTH